MYNKNKYERDGYGLNSIDRRHLKDLASLLREPQKIFNLIRDVPPKYLFNLHMIIKATSGLNNKNLIEYISKISSKNNTHKKNWENFLAYFENFNNPISEWRKPNGNRRDKYLKLMKNALKIKNGKPKLDKITIKKLINLVGKFYYRVPHKNKKNKMSDCDPYITTQEGIHRDTHGATHAIQTAKNMDPLYKMIIFLGINPTWPNSKKELSAEDLHLIAFAVAYHDSARLNDGIDYWNMQSAENFRRDAIKLDFDQKKVDIIAYSMALKDHRDTAFEFGKNNHVVKVKNWISVLINGVDGFEVIRCRKQYKKNKKGGFKYKNLFIYDALISELKNNEQFKPDNIEKFLENFTIQYSKWLNFCGRKHNILNSEFRKKNLESNKDIYSALDALFEKYKLRDLVAKICSSYKREGGNVFFKTIENIVKNKHEKEISQLTFFDVFTKSKRYKNTRNNITKEIKQYITTHKKDTIRESTNHQPSYSWDDIKKAFDFKDKDRLLIIRSLKEDDPKKALKYEDTLSKNIKSNIFKKKNKVIYNEHYLVNTTAIQKDKPIYLYNEKSLTQCANLVYVAVNNDIYQYWLRNAQTNRRINGSFKQPPVTKSLGKNKWTIEGIKYDLRENKNISENNEVLCKKYPRLVGIGIKIGENNNPCDAMACVYAMILLKNAKASLIKNIGRNKEIYIIGYKENGRIIKLEIKDLENKITYSDKNKKTEILISAIKENYIEIIKLMIKNGADVNKSDSSGKTPLIYAIKKKFIKLIKLLIEKGADVNKSDSSGLTPLIYAIQYELPIEVMTLLIEKGANVNEKNCLEMTPLMYAIQYGSRKWIEFLIEKGANVNERDSLGKTPLMYAIQYEFIELIEFLIKKGAKVNTYDLQNKTPLAYAQEYGHKKTERLLIKKGAKLKPTPRENDSNHKIKNLL